MFDYLKATRHPWACLLFVLPLLVVYEAGVVMLANGGDPTPLRNGADSWLRNRLIDYGFKFPWALPTFVALVLLVRSWWSWGDRPKRPLTAVFGTAVESVGFAVVLWLIARNFKHILDYAGVPFVNIQEQLHSVPANQMIRFVGAGIYEEVLFRMLLFSLLCVLFKFSLMPNIITVPLAAVAGAALFAAAHHFGPNGDPFEMKVFLFRGVAGLLFTALYQFRGFGVAVGAHAGYDILVGVLVQVPPPGG